MKRRTLKEIKAGNEVFNAMKPQQKRVAIAKDVLLALETSQLIPTECRYYDEHISYYEGSKQLQKQLNTDISCRVCAMGAILLSKARIGNAVSVTVYKADNLISNLKGIFSRKQLRLIETSFEGYVIGDDKILKDEEVERATIFWENCSTLDETMRLIMENIIKNRGTFKP